MRFLLDTNILSNLLRQSPSPSLMRRLALTPIDAQATSSITLGELYYGALRLSGEGVTLVAGIESELLPNLAIVSFDRAAARVYGQLRAELERAGTPIGDAHTRIAAIALSHDLTVVTANTRHFERVPGLRIENWLA